jgi:hypothetical protein
MRITGSFDSELLHQSVINELESEGVVITIDAEKRLFTAQIPARVPRDLLVSLVLRLKRAIDENFKEDYSVTQGSDGELTITTHYIASKYREIG